MTQLNKIDENWDLFEHKTKIKTYLKKLDENWDKKYFNLKFINFYLNVYNYIIIWTIHNPSLDLHFNLVTITTSFTH